MSDLTIEDYVSVSPSSIRLSGISSCMREIDMASPIDNYFLQSREILRYGTPERLSELSKLGGFLLLGLVSNAEGYFRSILSMILEICPICKSASAEKQINLGGILWHGKNEFRRSAFEHMSFASAKELTSATRTYLNYEMKLSIFKSVLEDFDAVCHLRHGLIHNGGILPGRNAVQIDIPPYSKPVEICINFAFLQNTAAVIDALVVTFNRALFLEICTRWATQWRQRSDWRIADERKRFMQIWKIFLCQQELINRSDKNKIKAGECMKRIKSEFGLA